MIDVLLVCFFFIIYTETLLLFSCCFRRRGGVFCNSCTCDTFACSRGCKYVPTYCCSLFFFVYVLAIPEHVNGRRYIVRAFDMFIVLCVFSSRVLCVPNRPALFSANLKRRAGLCFFQSDQPVALFF